jgi:hypothetical protein
MNSLLAMIVAIRAIRVVYRVRKASLDLGRNGHIVIGWKDE